MEWLAKLRTLLVGPDLEAVAREIAAQRRTSVWQRVHHRVEGMALAEARGYVRVKTSSLVRQAVEERITNDRHIRAAAAKHLQQLTMEAVLCQAIVDLLNARQLQQTQPATPVRIAA